MLNIICMLLAQLLLKSVNIYKYIQPYLGVNIEGKRHFRYLKLKYLNMRHPMVQEW